MLEQLLSIMADAIDPFLAILAFLFPWLERDSCTQLFGNRWKVWLPLLLALSMVYALLFVDNRFAIWPRFGLDYSTHTAFAVAIITLLIGVSSRWLWRLFALLVSYAFLMIHFGYHSLMDIVSTAVIIVTSSTLILRFTIRIFSRATTG